MLVRCNPRPRDVIQLCSGPINYKGTIPKDRTDSGNMGLEILKGKTGRITNNFCGPRYVASKLLLSGVGRTLNEHTIVQ